MNHKSKLAGGLPPYMRVGGLMIIGLMSVPAFASPCGEKIVNELLDMKPKPTPAQMITILSYVCDLRGGGGNTQASAQSQIPENAINAPQSRTNVGSTQPVIIVAENQDVDISSSRTSSTTTTTTTAPATNATGNTSTVKKDTTSATKTDLSFSNKRADLPNSKTNYYGDKVSFPVPVKADIQGVIIKPNGSEMFGSVADCYLPADLKLLGVSEDRVLLANKKKGVGFRLTEKSEKIYCPDPTDASHVKYDLVTVDEKATVQVGEEEFNVKPRRQGFSFGALAIPFKYQLLGNKEFKNQSTFGPYAGYNFESPKFGLGASFITFLGTTSVEIPQIVDGKTVNQNVTGYSYGFGLVGSIKDSFQLGVVFGADRVSKNAGYDQNGKPWIAAMIGYSFID